MLIRIVFDEREAKRVDVKASQIPVNSALPYPNKPRRCPNAGKRSFKLWTINSFRLRPDRLLPILRFINSSSARTMPPSVVVRTFRTTIDLVVRILYECGLANRANRVHVLHFQRGGRVNRRVIWFKMKPRNCSIFTTNSKLNFFTFYTEFSHDNVNTWVCGHCL